MLTRLALTGLPGGTTIAFRCSGRGCPVRSASSPRRLLRRALRAGLKIEIRATRPGFVGQVVVLTMRAGKAPRVQTLCAAGRDETGGL